MASTTLDAIEADLRFCEDVLNSKLKLVPTTSQSNSRVSSAGDSEPWATRQQHQAQQAQHDGPAVTPQKQYLQLHQIHAKQAAAAAAVAPWTGPGAVPAGAGGGAAPTARTADELLDLLSSVPEGQPFEIDAGLLYSPQSSYNAGDLDSPGSYGGGGGGNDDGASGGCDTLNFSLPAYCGSTDGRQPLYVDLGQAATALSPLRGGGSRGGHAAAASWTQPLQQAAGQGDGWQSAPGVSAVDARPASAPLPWEAPSSSGGSRSARQLLLDEVKATAGSQHQGVAAAATEEEAAAAAAPTIAAAAAAVASPGDRLHRLAQPRTQLWQRCAERRVQEEQAELLECTFAPNTGRPPRGRAQQQRQLASGLAVEERLQLSQQGRAEALQRARSEREREALAACTFAPQLVSQPERHLAEDYALTPLHQRLGEEQRRRRARLAVARLQQDQADADLTFRPQLNQRSLRLAAEREERQLLEQEQQQQRQQQGRTASNWPRSAATAAAAAAAAPAADFTFRPAINPASERLLEDSATLPSDFQQRQRFYSQRREAAASAAAAAADAATCTFRPDIGNAVEVLALSASRSDCLLESEAQRCERMAVEESAQLAERWAARQAKVYGDLDLQPALNPRSRALAPHGSGGWEALAAGGEQRRQRVAELAREAEERQLAECTFAPDTRKPRVHGYYDEYLPPQPSARLSIAAEAQQGFAGLTQRISEYQAEREARAAEARAAEAQRQLAQCSFAPAINRQRVVATGPVVVPGLERHLELVAAAARQRREAEERAARAFRQNPQLRSGATVARPFRLAGQALLDAKAAERQAAALEGALGRRMQDCTFRPQTNQQRRAAVLQRMLAQPGLDDSQLADPLQL